jgi:hypothetical protein
MYFISLEINNERLTDFGQVLCYRRMRHVLTEETAGDVIQADLEAFPQKTVIQQIGESKSPAHRAPKPYKFTALLKTSRDKIVGKMQFCN